MAQDTVLVTVSNKRRGAVINYDGTGYCTFYILTVTRREVIWRSYCIRNERKKIK
jgi:hypothetical protein